MNEIKFKDIPVAILCGGQGTRLKPLTNEIPKVLAPLNNKPIIDYILQYYYNIGFRKFVMCVGYKGEKVRRHLGETYFDCSLAYSDEGESASMLQRLVALKNQFYQDFLVCYGDTLIQLDVLKFLNNHYSKQAQVSIVSAKIRNPFGLISYDEKGFMTSFKEKPILNYYIGSFFMSYSAFDAINNSFLDKPDGQGLVEFFSELSLKKKVAVFEHAGAQITFNTESERLDAEKNINQFYTLKEKDQENERIKK